MQRQAGSILTALLLTSACQAATPYGPMNGRYGYSEQQIEQNRFQVTFRGNSSTPRETVEAFLLYRAAEITVNSGFNTFVVTERATDTTSMWRGTSYGPAVYGYYGPGYDRFPYYTHGYHWGYDATVRETRSFEAHAYIVMLKDGAAGDDVQRYDAHQVLLNLDPVVRASRARGY